MVLLYSALDWLLLMMVQYDDEVFIVQCLKIAPAKEGAVLNLYCHTVVLL